MLVHGGQPALPPAAHQLEGRLHGSLPGWRWGGAVGANEDSGLRDPYVGTSALPHPKYTLESWLFLEFT